MANFTFRGLIAPTFTPFGSDMSLDLQVIPQYAKYLQESGIRGVLVNGTTGEGMSMSVNERKLVTEEWAKAVRKTGQHLMVQIGGAPLPDVMELARHGEKLGVDSLLCLPDLYYKPTNAEDLINYLKIVAIKAPNTPLLYYHIPGFTNVNIHMGEFLRKVSGNIDNFGGIKFTSVNLDEGIDAVKCSNGKFAVFLGADQLMAGAFTLGFDSAIATTLNIYPKIGIQILDYIKESNVEKAREAQNLLSGLCTTIAHSREWVSAMKVAMNSFTSIPVGLVRAPLINYSLSEVGEMERAAKLMLKN